VVNKLEDTYVEVVKKYTLDGAKKVEVLYYFRFTAEWL